MADVRREPKIPPITTPLLQADGKTMNPAWHRYLQGERGYSDNVNSGVTAAAAAATAAQVAAVQAQATATGAIAGVATLADQTAPGGFFASCSPSSAFGSRVGSGLVTTASVTVSPTGGTPAYTYAWTLASGNFTILTPTAAATTFRASVAIGETVEDIATCTVTDSLAATTSISIGVAIYSEGTPP
jgi:hypothetical protein